MKKKGTKMNNRRNFLKMLGVGAAAATPVVGSVFSAKGDQVLQDVADEGWVSVKGLIVQGEYGTVRLATEEEAILVSKEEITEETYAAV
jgi:hypothetical protein